ncbi:hypothetical protein ES707_12656 [subsurface metagenome]
MKEYLRQLTNEQPNILLKRSVAREYLQTRILQSLQEEGAFLNIAFLGGTSLRFLYYLPRYSEDLDFSVLPSKKIDFKRLLNKITIDLEREGYQIKIKESNKKTVTGAFIKFQSLLYDLDLSQHKDEVLSIKLEIDTNPPKGEVTTTTVVKKYIMLNLLHYDRASLFAGKMHAILSRNYTKGRDLFDLIWMLANPSWPLPNFIMLNNALAQTGWRYEEINNSNWKKILIGHISKINWKRVIADVSPFLEREADKKFITYDNCTSLIEGFNPRLTS